MRVMPSDLPIGVPAGRARPGAAPFLVAADGIAVLLAILAARFLLDLAAPAIAGGGTAGLLPRRMLVHGLALMALFAVSGHYTERRPFATEARLLMMATATLGLFDGALLLALPAPQPLAGWMIAWPLLAGLLLASRAGGKHLLYRCGRWRCPTVVIGTARQIKTVTAAIGADPHQGYSVEAVIGIEGGADSVLARLDELRAGKALGCVVVAFDEAHGPESLRIARRIEDELDIPLSLVPSFSGLSVADLELRRFVGHDLVFLSHTRRSSRAAWHAGKRVFDLAVTLGLLLFTGPLLLAIAALVCLDGGPAFYGSPRLGRDGRIFLAWKFRSMVPDAGQALQDLLARDPAARQEWEANFKLRRDPRITRIGRFLRRSSLDELPQLLNVLKGEMSLVGPRPIVPAERARYADDAFALYRRVTPGLTGMWQVSGRNDLDYARRIELNVWYIKNWSPWLDLFILIKTAFVVTRGRGAY